MPANRNLELNLRHGGQTLSLANVIVNLDLDNSKVLLQDTNSNQAVVFDLFTPAAEESEQLATTIQELANIDDEPVVDEKPVAATDNELGTPVVQESQQLNTAIDEQSATVEEQSATVDEQSVADEQFAAVDETVSMTFISNSDPNTLVPVVSAEETDHQWFKPLYVSYFVLEDGSKIPSSLRGGEFRLLFRFEGMAVDPKMVFYISGGLKSLVTKSGFPATLQFRAASVLQMNFTSSNNEETNETLFDVTFESLGGVTTGLAPQQTDPTTESLRCHMKKMAEPRAHVHFSFCIPTVDVERHKLEDHLETIKTSFAVPWAQYRSQSSHTAMTKDGETNKD